MQIVNDKHIIFWKCINLIFWLIQLFEKKYISNKFLKTNWTAERIVISNKFQIQIQYENYAGELYGIAVALMCSILWNCFITINSNMEEAIHEKNIQKFKIAKKQHEFVR